MEGVLDEDLAPEQDFTLTAAFPVRILSGLDGSLLVSGNLDTSDYWCFVLRCTENAADRLLQSNTQGYLLGARMKDAHGHVVARLIRSAGYSDGDIDLLLHDGVVDYGGGDILVFGRQHCGSA